MDADLPNRDLASYVQLIPTVGECVVPEERRSAAIRIPKSNSTISSIRVEESSHGNSPPSTKDPQPPFQNRKPVARHSRNNPAGAWKESDRRVEISRLWLLQPSLVLHLNGRKGGNFRSLELYAEGGRAIVTSNDRLASP